MDGGTRSVPRRTRRPAPSGREALGTGARDSLMSLILCHQCFSWVEPIGEQCPQCDFPLDARAPDPSPEELNAAIGSLVRPMGEIRIARAELPERGWLYETNHGLFFVPNRLEQVKLVPRGSSPKPMRSLLAAWLRIPRSLFPTRRPGRE